MPMVFACSVSHTPGIRAWADAPPTDQKERFYASYDVLREKLWAAQPDTILIISSEHFANFFLDCMPAFAIGQSERYFGPIEPWVKIAQGYSRGDPELSSQLLATCYAEGLEPNYSSELQLDHGIMIPLSFLDPGRELPVVPLIINCMTYPMPTQKRCYELGRILEMALRSQERRVAVVAAGGLSHAPGERIHGNIDPAIPMRCSSYAGSGRMRFAPGWRLPGLPTVRGRRRSSTNRSSNGPLDAPCSTINDRDRIHHLAWTRSPT